ncbi:MAG TPA: glycerol-3-phosphate dehydrogenase, partial [Methylophaga sp.]|nr:glycerol-3-phosphate dehydrogenase [Methylophaga sp.]
MTSFALMPTLVIGAGAWGTALAIAMARNGHEIWLWGRDKEQLARIAAERMNSRYLPEIILPDTLKIEMDLEKALTHCKHVMVSVPSAAFSETLLRIKPVLPQGIPVSWSTKGLTPHTGQFLHDTAIEI